MLTQYLLDYSFPQESLFEAQFEKSHSRVVPDCPQKMAEMQLQPQGRPTAAQMEKKMMMTYFLHIEPPPVRVTRGIKHWCRQSEEGRSASTKPRRLRDPARSFALVPTNFRARFQAPGSPLKTPIWQRCRCWTSPCWTTRARSETRSSSRLPSSAWKICRRVSEWLHVRHWHGFSAHIRSQRGAVCRSQLSVRHEAARLAADCGPNT